MFRKKKPVQPAPMVQLGPTTFIDPEHVTAIYVKDNRMVVRIGGMGVIELCGGDLFKRVPESIKILAEAVNKQRECLAK